MTTTLQYYKVRNICRKMEDFDITTKLGTYTFFVNGTLFEIRQKATKKFVLYNSDHMVARMIGADETLEEAVHTLNLYLQPSISVSVKAENEFKTILDVEDNDNKRFSIKLVKNENNFKLTVTDDGNNKRRCLNKTFESWDEDRYINEGLSKKNLNIRYHFETDQFYSAKLFGYIKLIGRKEY